MLRWLPPLIATVLLAAAAFYWFGPWSQQRLATRWQKELISLESDQLPVRMRQLSQLGEHGLAVVVESIDHERIEVSQSARRELEHQLRVWRQASPLLAVANVHVVAKTLATMVDRSAPSTRIFAADIASQLLAWPTPAGQSNQQLIAHCETVLAGAVLPVPKRATPVAAPYASNSNTRPVAQRRTQYTQPKRLERKNLELAGGGLPVELAQVPSSLGRLDTLDGSTPQPNRRQGKDQSFPPQLLRDNEAKPLNVNNKSSSVRPDAGANRPSLIQPAPAARRLSAVGARPTSTPAEPAWAKLTDVAIMRRLHSNEPLRIRAAWKELRRRGYRVSDLGMAQEVTHPEAKHRLAAIEQITGLQLSDGRRWLLILSQDTNKRVRKAAVSVMATTQDLQLVERLRKMLSTESDPDVLSLLKKRLSRP